MVRITFRAVAFVSLLIALVLSINLLVGAQEPPKPPTGDPKTQKTDKQKGSQPDAAKQADKDKAAQSTTLSPDERKFIIEAAHGGMTEIELGKLAAQKATSDDVKQFAQRIIDYHSKANDELMQLASQKGVTLPKSDQSATVEPVKSGRDKDKAGATDKEHKAIAERYDKIKNQLASLSGADFDREYIKLMVEDHAKEVAAFEKIAAGATDPDLKAWAGKTLPTLQEHLKQARELEAKVK